MKIILLTLNNFTHDTRIHRTAKTLAQAGNQVTVLALWQAGLQEHEDHPSGYRVERIRLASRPWRNRWAGPLVKYLEYVLRVWNLAGRLQADVYHANDANTLPAAWLAARRNKAKLVYDAHELETGRSWSASRVAGVYKYFLALPEKIFIRHADAVITVSQSIARRLVQLYDIPLPVVIMNCPEVPEISAQPSQRLREEMNIPPKLKIALYQGGVDRGRGVEALIDATQRTPGVAAVILGDGELSQILWQRVQTGDLQRVYLHGKVPPASLPEYTSSADIGIVLTELICESHRLSLPNKIFEYLHAGLPVIATNAPEIAQIVQSEQVGIVVDPRKTDEIANALLSVAELPEQNPHLRSHILEVAKKFTWEIERVKLLELYSRMAGKSL